MHARVLSAGTSWPEGVLWIRLDCSLWGTLTSTGVFLLRPFGASFLWVS